MRRPLYRIRVQRIAIRPVPSPRRIGCYVACEGVADGFGGRGEGPEEVAGWDREEG